MSIAIDVNPDWEWDEAEKSSHSSLPFSPQANSLIIVEVHVNSTSASFTTTLSSSVGAALTWTQIGTAQRNTTGGWVHAYWTYTTVTHSNMTVTATGPNTQYSIKTTTYTGTATTNAVISKSQGQSSTNNLTVNVTNTNNDCRIRGTALDWQARGQPLSVDEEMWYDNTFISGLSVQKATNTVGTGQTVSINFDAAGTQSASWSYKIYEIVPAPISAAEVALTPATTTMTAVTITSVPGAVAMTLTPATVMTTAIAAMATPQPVTQVLAPAVITTSITPVTPTAQSVIQALTLAVTTVAAVAVTASPQAVIAVLTSAVVTTSATPVTSTPQAVTVVLAPTPVTLTAVSLSSVAEEVNVTVTSAAVTLSAVPTIAVPQPVAATLVHADAIVTAVSVASSSFVALTSTTVTMTARSLDATPQLIDVTLTPIALTTVALTTSPTPQAVTVPLVPATTAVTPLALGVGGVGVVTLSTAILNVITQALTAVPGVTSIELTSATVSVTSDELSGGAVGTTSLTSAVVNVQATPVVSTPQPVTVHITVAQATIVAVTPTVGVNALFLVPVEAALRPSLGVYATIMGVDLMTIAYVTVTGVGEYIRSELEQTIGGVPDRFVHITPGQIAWDACDCGQFAQTITGVSSSKSFPSSSDDSAAAACGHPFMIVAVTMSLVRCVPGIDPEASPQSPVPDVVQLMRAAEILEEDRTTLRRALFRHLKSLYDQYKIKDFSISAANSVGPEGQCGGVEINYSFAVSNDAVCS